MVSAILPFSAIFFLSYLREDFIEEFAEKWPKHNVPSTIMDGILYAENICSIRGDGTILVT